MACSFGYLAVNLANLAVIDSLVTVFPGSWKLVVSFFRCDHGNHGNLPVELTDLATSITASCNITIKMTSLSKLGYSLMAVLRQPFADFPFDRSV
ncbi:hypothetical protein AK812_SmicGene9414 [Symbiodinium microadriaticum]|uniref:Uncharacterized protein n=1 Tax=Symbiodinium microadriaticum TaxID=2951 RepID=A0A1Q9EIM9_SYMMI|nr:hypothetical protein AK812_SmicGene9414 [Symbiodinium microadriaticum]